MAANQPSTPTIPGNAPEATRPDYIRPEHKALQPDRDLCTALSLGTKGVRALKKVGLPQWPAEKDANYAIRSTIAQVARYYQRTVQATVGMICSTPPSFDKATDALILKDAEDIDGRGTHFEVYAREVTEEAIHAGFVGILVDSPPIPEGLNLTLGEEQALGIRPVWVTIPADRIISWIVEVPDWAALLKDYADTILTADQVAGYARQTIVRQVVIYEPTDVKDGEYGVTCKHRFRVLKLSDNGVFFFVWEKRSGDGTAGEHFALISSGEMLQAGRKPFREIPLAVTYAGKKHAAFVASPPHLALAELNLAHYQVSADRLYMMKICHAPTFTTMGWEDPTGSEETGRAVKQEVGPHAWLKLPINGNAQYTAADPGVLDSSKQEKDDLVRQMAALGMSFLGQERKVPETATGRALDDAAENADHSTIGRRLQDGLEQAARFHAMYRGVEPPSVKVNTVYAAPEVDPQIAAILWQAVVAGVLDVESWIEYVRTGQLPEDIKERLEVLKLAAAMNADLQTDPNNPDKKPANTRPPTKQAA